MLLGIAKMVITIRSPTGEFDTAVHGGRAPW